MPRTVDGVVEPAIGRIDPTLRQRLLHQVVLAGDLLDVDALELDPFLLEIPEALGQPHDDGVLIDTHPHLDRRRFLDHAQLVWRRGRVELLHLFRRGGRGQRQIAARARHVRLTLLAEHVAEKLAQLRIDAGELALLVIDVEDGVDRPRQRIAAVGHRLARGVDVRPRGRLRQRERFHAGCRGIERRVGDAGRVIAQIGDHQRGVGVLAQVFVPQVGAMHDARLEVRDRARSLERRRVDMDRFVGPGAGRAELSPVADVQFRPARGGHVPTQAVPAAAALRTEDRVELLHRQFRDRIVAMHEDGVRRRLVGRGEAAGSDLDLDRKDPRALVGPVVFERVHRAAHQREIGGAHLEAVDPRRGPFERAFEADVRMEAAETLLPALEQRGHLVVAAHADRTGHVLRRVVFGQRRHNEQGCDEGAHSSFLSSVSTCSALSGMKMRLSATIC